MTTSLVAARRHRTRMLLVTLTVLTGLFVGTPTYADSDPADPNDPATPPTVTADALPTTQIDGVVWSQAIANGRVYVGGAFSNARPAGSPVGTNEVTRNNLLAYDLETGDLVASFAPEMNADVTSVAASPDKSRIYVGGNFTTVNGTTRRRIAAFDTSTGDLVSDFAPPVYGSVDAIVATDDVVYAGGSFLGVGSVDRRNLAAFDADDGALLNWAPKAEGGEVSALAMSSDQSKIAVGGSFTAVDGSSDPGYGLAMVDAVSGEGLPMQINDLIRNGTSNAAITTLSSDGDLLYGGGYRFGGGGNFEGVFAADWDGGDVHWINDCQGDTYAVHPHGDVLYQAGHDHYCEDIGGFPETDRLGGRTWHRATAMSKAATGTVSWDPTGRFSNFGGQPAPSPLTWFPSLNIGSATGQWQGPWHVTGNGDYIVMGGEFTRVNNRAQQGLVRFTVKEKAPNERGPRLYADTFPIKVDSPEPGLARISWAANHDQDNRQLTYRVYRDSQNASGLVHTRQRSADFWKLPGMGHADTGLEPGSSHRYRVSVTDSSGNIANSPWVEVEIATSGNESVYERAVRGSNPTHYWRLGDSSGSEADDAVGWAPAVTSLGVLLGAEGAISDDPDTAARFTGTSISYAATDSIDVPPDRFTIEAWFNTERAQGKIIGWGNRNDRGSSKTDRHLYLDGSGRVHFGLKPDADRTTIASDPGYADGAWHHVAASLSDTGMQLYLDGEAVAQRTDVTVGEHWTPGYWRIGGDTLSNWPSAPWTGYFDGVIDEVAVYDQKLSDAEIATHYETGAGVTEPNIPPTPEFSPHMQGLTLTADASGSHDPDGDIASYSWDFGDSTTSEQGEHVTHTYDTSGDYDVQLTVTDDDGATRSVTRTVTATNPPADRVIALDAFQRSVSNGLGRADIGGRWERTGPAVSYAVTNGTGRIRTGAPRRGKAAYLGSVASAHTNLRADLALNKPPVGGNARVSVTGRRVNANNEYKATLLYGKGGRVKLSLVRVVRGNSTRLRSTMLPGLSTNDRLRIRTQVRGEKPTWVRAKVWQPGAPQPATWQLSTKDGASRLQMKGAIGVDMHLARVRNTPIVARIDRLKAMSVG